MASIQGSTQTTVTEIESITRVIHDVNELVGTIATAVTEQSATTQEIAANVSQASHGIESVNQKVADNTTLSSEIAHSIADVDQATSDMAKDSNQVKESASTLRNFAGQLTTMVGQFKI